MRALLIQIGVKPLPTDIVWHVCLRALLIQIGVNLEKLYAYFWLGLRALCLCSDRDTGIVLIFFKISRLIL